MYLIHFRPPAVGHARHYLGMAADVTERIKRHRNGNGARLMAVAAERRVDWLVARLWPRPDAQSARELERRLKTRHNGPRLCPVCSPNLHP